MELSLFSRDVIAMSTAVALSHDVFDGSFVSRVRMYRTDCALSWSLTRLLPAVQCSLVFK